MLATAGKQALGAVRYNRPNTEMTDVRESVFRFRDMNKASTERFKYT